MTINKGLFAHIVVTLILIAGYQFIMVLEKKDTASLFTWIFLIILINVFISAHCSEYGLYKQKIKL